REVLVVDLRFVEPAVAGVFPVGNAGVDIDVEILGCLEYRGSTESTEIGIATQRATDIDSAASGLFPRELPESQMLTELARELTRERTELRQECGWGDETVCAKS